MKIQYTIEVDWPINLESYDSEQLESYLTNAIENYHLEIGSSIFDYDSEKPLVEVIDREVV